MTESEQQTHQPFNIVCSSLMVCGSFFALILNVRAMLKRNGLAFWNVCHLCVVGVMITPWAESNRIEHANCELTRAMN